MSDIKDALKEIEAIENSFKNAELTEDGAFDDEYDQYLTDCLFQQIDIITECMNNPTS